MRESLRFSDGPFGIAEKMAEQNPGAMSVLMNMMGIMDVLCLDDMNIRGSQIWYGFKDYCGEDMNLFLKSVKSRDENMIKTINICVAKFDSVKHKAVRYGASNSNAREMLNEEEVAELSTLPVITNSKINEK